MQKQDLSYFATKKRQLAKKQQFSDENYLDESLLDRQISTLSLNTITFVQYLKVIFSGYEFNIEKWMSNYDKIRQIQRNSRIDQINQVICEAPGYKSTQVIFTYYLITSNYLNAVLMALLYPLPYTLLFIWIGYLLYQLQITQNYQFSVLILIILTGVRSSVIALLTKYALHLPEGKFYRIIFISSVLISLIFRNNYIFFCLYIISIVLAFYAKQDGRNSKAISQKQQKKCKSFKQYPVPNTYPQTCIIIIAILILGIWFYSRYSNDYQYIVLQQFILIGLLSHTKQMAVFFPLLFISIYGDIPNLHAADIIGINYLLPGSHIKPFFVLIGQDISYFDCTVTYVCLYLPSIMLISIYLGYRQQFHSLLWDNVRKAMQAVSNGLILTTVFWLLYQQSCNFNVVAYSAVVILCVVKLYYLRELFAAFLGVFLVFSRAGVLYLYKGYTFQEFVCLNKYL